MAYLYRHIRLDKNIPFYIGVGIDDKGKYYRAKSRHGRNAFWKSIVEKTNYDIEILFESESYEEITKKEKEFIELYGRKDLGKGSLTNLTDGGEGFTGYKFTEADRKKMSESRKGKYGRKGEKHPMYGRKGVLHPCYGIIVSDETRRKLSESNKGEKHPNYGKKRDKEICIKIGLANKGQKRPTTSEKFKGEGNPFFGKKHSYKSMEKRSKKVIDTSTNIIYKSIFDASEKLNINYNNLKYWLGKSIFKKTSLRYCKKDK
jgi:hypothetical protein